MSTRWTASLLLDAVERARGTSAFVRELTVADSAYAAAMAELDSSSGPEVFASAHATPQTRRIDALMFDNLQRTAIEVKVSVADAKRETWHKVAPWWDITHRYVYVVPAGLIDQAPVNGAGLWWVHDDGRVEVKRKATLRPHPEPLPQRVVQTIAYRACGRSTIQRQTVQTGATAGVGSTV